LRGHSLSKTFETKFYADERAGRPGRIFDLNILAMDLNFNLELKTLGRNKSDILNLLDRAWQSGRLIDELLQSE